MAATHDLVVVGTGGAAMSAGIAARARGADVLLIERGVVGGTCLNIGCVPSKTLLAAAGHRADAGRNPFPGAPAAAPVAVHLSALGSQKDALVEQLRGSKYLAVAEAHGFEIRPGHAVFDSPDLLLVDDEPVPAVAYLVATGAEPAMPDLPGLDTVRALTSTTAMALTVLPDSLVIIGGGYVGMEQAQLFAGLGTRVTLVGRLAPHTEPELADVLRAAFADGVTVVEQRASRVERTGPDVTVHTTDGQQVRAEHLLVATGRSPRSQDLLPQVAKIDLDGRGFITVDDHQRTSNPKVWAAGDVTGAPQYVYVAPATGRAAAINAFGGTARVDFSALPAVTFTRPQLAGAGMSEQQALTAGYDCDCRTVTAAELPRALVNHDPYAALKIVADATTGQVLGVHAAMDGAGEVIAAAVFAIRAGMTVDDLADTWSPYLTMSEALRIAAGRFRTDKPTSCCA